MIERLCTAWAYFGPVARRIVSARSPNQRPVLVVSLPRSGSSWVGESLGLSGSAAYLREPINQSFLKRHPSKTVFDVSPDNPPSDYARLSTLAFSGIPKFPRHVIPNPTQWALGQTHRRTVVIKEVNPLALRYWLSTFDPKVIVLVRHPAAVALSLHAMRWGQRPFDNWFSPGRRKSLADMVARLDGDYWASIGAAQAIVHRELHDCINGNDSALLIRYETLCENPEHIFQQLYEFAGLDWDENTRVKITERSSGGSVERGTYGTQRNSIAMVNAWRNQIGSAELGALQGAYISANGGLYDADDW